MAAQALFHTAPHIVELREARPLKPTAGELLVRTHCSAISPGAESLIFRGGMPENWELESSASSNPASKPRYPLQFKSSLVGEVVKTGSHDDHHWQGKRVFFSHPHQSAVVINKSDCYPLPPGMASERALFLAYMEAALSLGMDASPMVGERGMIFGQGIIGLLLT